MNFVRLIQGPIIDGQKTLAQITSLNSVHLDVNKLPNSCALKSILIETSANITFFKSDSGKWRFKIDSILGTFTFGDGIRDKKLFEKTDFWSSISKQIWMHLSVKHLDNETATDIQHQCVYKGNAEYEICESVGFHSFEEEECNATWETLWSNMIGGVSNPLVVLIMLMRGRLDFVTSDCGGESFRLQNSNYDVWRLTGIEKIEELNEMFFVKNVAMLSHFFSNHSEETSTLARSLKVKRTAPDIDEEIVAEWVRNSLLVDFPDEQEETVQNNVLNPTLECKICMEKQCNAIFSPCNHIVACFSCAAKTAVCPICRGNVAKFSKCFFG